MLTEVDTKSLRFDHSFVRCARATAQGASPPTTPVGRFATCNETAAYPRHRQARPPYRWRLSATTAPAWDEVTP